MHKTTLLALLCLFTFGINAQDTITKTKKQRLDFAKTYFEFGGSYFPSFTGKMLDDQQVIAFQHPASLNQYLTWGAFHFWGHAELYVTIPLQHHVLKKNESSSFQLIHSVATGARIYPWTIKEKQLRPYVGLSWGALDFQQTIAPEENPVRYSKDMMLNFEAGLTFLLKSFGARLGINYFPNHTWEYPLSKTVKENIITPAYALQLGAFYTFDSSKNSKHKDVDSWNDFPAVSGLSYNSTKKGDFFMGLGISGSYSLVPSEYNQTEFPYLKEKLFSNPFLDLALGYQFNRPSLYIALSYRNPKYETSGYGAEQKINKKSLTLEVVKFLTDYSGFAPFVGINLAYDHLKYSETVEGTNRELSFNNKLDPGFNFGWDIVPGKTSEALILRTNIRWYPFSSFEVDGKPFDFSQLEYNLIQAVFYPGRLNGKTK